MKFQVGYQDNRAFVEYLLAHGDKVSEIYFPWNGIATGRGIESSEVTMRNLCDDLRAFSDAGIRLCLLLNGNCYGRHALARSFLQKVGDTVDYLVTEYSLSGATTASPIIAKFLKRNFPSLEIRASVNMEIGTTEGVEYLEDYFDSFYLKREYNYDAQRIQRLLEFCHQRGKKLYLLANSGCLNFCSARTFHDNLVAHQHEVAEMDNAFEFHGECTVFLKKGDNLSTLLSRMNLIRPEDVALYEGKCDGMKLATRTNFNPMAVAYAYFNGKWHGNLLDLTEPAHSELLLPKIISNGKIPPEYAKRRMDCPMKCDSCRFCMDVQKNATVVLDEDSMDAVNLNPEK